MSSAKKIILIISLCTIPFILLILSRILKFYIFYSVPTAGMEPNVKVHQILFASSLITPKKNDIVSYNGNPAGFPGETIAQRTQILGRIVASENDTLEIKNGLMYINNKFVDDTMNLSYNYLCKQSETAKYPKNKILPYSQDSVILNVSPNELKELRILSPKRLINQYYNEYIHPELFGCSDTLKWSEDIFGPVVIPKNHFFIMGDNRGNSADSRYRGFVDKNDIVAVIVK